MSALHRSRTIIAALAAAAAAVVVGVVVTSTPAQAATCSDVDAVFARGTGEAAGLGSVGTPFVKSLTGDLPGLTVSSYAVDYAANTSQSSAGPGATDLTNHVTSVAAACPSTRFVLGGYSQGATVVDIALGIKTGNSTGTPIPTNLAPRVASIVVFGNPLGLQKQTIATASTLYGARSKDYCNTGDPVCGNGSNTAAHLQYASNGSTTSGATFAAGFVTSGTAPAPSPTATPTATPTASPTATPTPTSPPTSPAAACYTASTTAQVYARRAVTLRGSAYARGTNDRLGVTSTSNIVSLSQVDTNSWTLVPSC